MFVVGFQTIHTTSANIITEAKILAINTHAFGKSELTISLVSTHDDEKTIISNKKIDKQLIVSVLLTTLPIFICSLPLLRKAGTNENK
jgi:hypothetical protein